MYNTVLSYNNGMRIINISHRTLNWIYIEIRLSYLIDIRRVIYSGLVWR